MMAVVAALTRSTGATSDRRDTGDLLSMLVKNSKLTTCVVVVGCDLDILFRCDSTFAAVLHRAFFRVELSFEQGERLDVIRMTSCPGGHWYCRRQQDEQEEGYVPIDRRTMTRVVNSSVPVLIVLYRR
jgi:hypothetical protein